MRSRLAAALVVVSMILAGTGSPAVVCAIGCARQHGIGHEHHELAATGMSGHHHDGMMRMEPASQTSFASRLCEENCSGRLVMARVEKSLLSQERVSSEFDLQPGDEGVRTAQGKRDAVSHFEVAGPPGPANCGKSILRI